MLAVIFGIASIQNVDHEVKSFKYNQLQVPNTNEASEVLHEGRTIAMRFIAWGVAGAAIYGVVRGMQNGNFKQLLKNFPKKLNLQQMAQPVQKMTQPLQQMAQPLQKMAQPLQQMAQPVQKMTQPLQQMAQQPLQ
jgi:uncharacterized sporulation protein YeaH/YhbH (DUF444 family)